MVTFQHSAKLSDLCFYRPQTKAPPHVQRGGAFGILLRRLTDAGVLLLLFIPGIRVVQHRAERENERSVKKLCRAAAEAVRALRARLEQVILRICLRREPCPPLLSLRATKGRLNVREASLPEIRLLTERRIREVGSLKARPVEVHRPRERHLTEADTRRERRLTKVGILREGALPKFAYCGKSIS